MVKGINRFREYFQEYTDQYVLIGGAACDISFENSGTVFRATKDLDMVLVVESLTKEFGERFWAFIKDGGYQNLQKSSGQAQFYRFSKPLDAEFPFMIELFARTERSLPEDAKLISIHIDEDVSSLSAILLNEAYYHILMERRTVIDGVSILDATGLLLFKMKAWLDLKEKSDGGFRIQSHDIKKHRNDVIRIVSEITLDQYTLSGDVGKDMRQFIETSDIQDQDIRNLGIRGIGAEDIRARLTEVFL